MPQFFELRLDALHAIADELFEAAADLRAPLIITARHPAEGGLNALRTAKRRDLLLRFLPLAALVDVEARSHSELQSVLVGARDRKVGIIHSVHDLIGTPASERLDSLLGQAKEDGADLFKLATRTNTKSDLDRLVTFFQASKGQIPLSVMPIGSDSRRWRLYFAREGSALNYTHLGEAQIEGQWSLPALRSALQRRTA